MEEKVSINQYFFKSKHSNYGLLLFLTVLSFLLVSIGDIYQSRVFLVFMNRALGINNYEYWQLIIYGFLFALIYYIISFLSSYLLAKLMAKIRKEISIDFLEKQLALPTSSFYKEESQSTLTNFITGEINNLVDNYFSLVVELFGVGISLILGLVYLSYLSVFFLIPLILTIIFIIILLIVSKKKTEQNYKKLFSYNTSLIKVINNISSCFSLSNMFSYRKQLVNKFSSSFDNYNNQRRDAVLYDNILAKINGLLSLVLFLVIYLIAIFLSIQQRINGGDIVAIIQVSSTIISPFFVIANVIKSINSTKDTRTKLSNLLSKDNSRKNIEEVKSISINNVSFSYLNKIIFSNISFSLKSQTLVVISGASGKGKTTLLNIIGKINTDYSGNIIINNEDDLKVISDESYYKNVKYMSQVPIILDASIKDNIILNEEFEEEKFNSIIKLLKLDQSFNNYEMLLNTEKTNYSLGEARRINFARMLYSNAKYILMDEPFASLDEENRLIMENVILLQKDKCIVITSHVVSSDFLSKVNIKIDL